MGFSGCLACFFCIFWIFLYVNEVLVGLYWSEYVKIGWLVVVIVFLGFLFGVGIL